MIKTFSGWPTVKRTGIGRFFIGRYTVFANCKGVIAVVAQNLRDGSGSGRNPAVPSREACGKNGVRKTGFMHGCAVASRQESCAGWSADRARVEIRIAQAIRGQVVERGCLDESAKRA